MYTDQEEDSDLSKATVAVLSLLGFCDRCSKVSTLNDSLYRREWVGLFHQDIIYMGLMAVPQCSPHQHVRVLDT